MSDPFRVLLAEHAHHVELRAGCPWCAALIRRLPVPHPGRVAGVRGPGWVERVAVVAFYALGVLLAVVFGVALLFMVSPLAGLI